MRPHVVCLTALLTLLAGCSALTAPFRRDPVIAALYTTRSAMLRFRQEVVIPKCTLREPAEEDRPFCKRWINEIDPAVTTAHNAAVDLIATLTNEEDRIREAAAVISLTSRVLEGVQPLLHDERALDVLVRIKASLDAIALTLQGSSAP